MPEYKVFHQITGRYVGQVDESLLDLFDVREYHIEPSDHILEKCLPIMVAVFVEQLYYDEAGSFYRELQMPITTPGLKLNAYGKFILPARR